jgi:hypothetical protein
VVLIDCVTIVLEVTYNIEALVTVAASANTGKFLLELVYGFDNFMSLSFITSTIVPVYELKSVYPAGFDMDAVVNAMLADLNEPIN